MTDALIAWAEANQAIAVTPFLLAGATSPVSLAGGLAQQVAETLSGVAMAQLVSPGVPCLYGSFFTPTDMRTGSPAFGTPEAVLAGTDVVLHAAGWLEGGLVASFEKFMLDVELLDSFARMMPGIGSSQEEVAFDAIAELGPGGLFLGSPYTMAHFRDWLTMSPLFTTPDFATWELMGAERAEHRATALWKKLLDSYEDPGLDPAIDEELRTFMERRRQDPPEPED